MAARSNAAARAYGFLERFVARTVVDEKLPPRKRSRWSPYGGSCLEPLLGIRISDPKRGCSLHSRTRTANSSGIVVSISGRTASHGTLGDVAVYREFVQLSSRRVPDRIPKT